MKDASGVTRKIDILGRVCIPEELRKKCNINYNEEVEMSFNNSAIEIRKFVPRTYSFVSLLKQLVQTIATALDARAFIADGENILVSSVDLSVYTQWAGTARQVLMSDNKFVETQLLELNGCRFKKMQISIEMRLFVQYKSAFTENQQIVLKTCVTIIKDILNWLSVRE